MFAVIVACLVGWLSRGLVSLARLSLGGKVFGASARADDVHAGLYGHAFDADHIAAIDNTTRAS